MLYLITGSPGSGKTLSAIDWILKLKEENPGRLIYAANIDGLNVPGVIHMEHADVGRWFEVCEKNSIIFVDEAQRYWRAQRSGEPAQSIIEMETHRHDGIDIVMMTQHPTFLHSNIRKLINVHVHLVAYTKNSALRWEWRECHDDVQDNALRAGGEFKEWHYPARCFDSYTSATQHTKRAKRPLRQILGRVALGFAALVLLGGVVVVGVLVARYRKGPSLTAVPALGLKPSAASSGDPRQGGRPVYATPADYADALRPRIESMPWSAPVYDGQAVTQHPRLYCIAVEDPRACSCVTEQGTHPKVSDAVCHYIAMNGPEYDPFLPDKRQDFQPPAGQLPAQPPAVVSVPPSSPSLATATGWPSGVGSAEYTPPGAPGSWNPNALSGQRSR